MTRLSRQSQPDLVLAKVALRLQAVASPSVARVMEGPAWLVLVGVIYTFLALLWVWG